MSKRAGPYPTKYTIVKVDHYDGRVTFELRNNNDVIREYPETALQHAIDALTKIEEYQGLRKESELFSLDLTKGSKTETTEES
jgi:hypothetical protein